MTRWLQPTFRGGRASNGRLRQRAVDGCLSSRLASARLLRRPSSQRRRRKTVHRAARGPPHEAHAVRRHVVHRYTAQCLLAGLVSLCGAVRRSATVLARGLSRRATEESGPFSSRIYLQFRRRGARKELEAHDGVLNALLRLFLPFRIQKCLCMFCADWLFSVVLVPCRLSLSLWLCVVVSPRGCVGGGRGAWGVASRAVAQATTHETNTQT